jgi:hypothetical protein
MSILSKDKQTILDLGGPTEVARLLGLDIENGGVQRVQNWIKRGIPPKEKLARPDLFLPEFRAAKLITKPRKAVSEVVSVDPSDSVPEVRG